MNNETTYVERAGSMNAAAMAERIRADAEKLTLFKAQTLILGRHSIIAGNITRELGQSFAEYWLPNDAAAAENHFNAHYGPVLGVGFHTFQWIISASRKLPEKCESAADTYQAQKQIWFAGGLIEEGERAAAQESHDATPLVTVADRLNKARVAMDKTFEGVSGWDKQMRWGVSEQIKKFEEWLAGIKARLGSEPDGR